MAIQDFTINNHYMECIIYKKKSQGGQRKIFCISMFFCKGKAAGICSVERAKVGQGACRLVVAKKIVKGNG